MLNEDHAEQENCCFLERDSRYFADLRQFGSKVTVNHKRKLSLYEMALACCMTDLQSKTPSSRLADKSIQKEMSITGGTDVKQSSHVLDRKLSILVKY